MTHRLVVLAILAAATVTLPAQKAGDARPPEAVVEIDTVFLDRSGEPVLDIKRDEVEVWVAGYRVPLEKFMAVTPEDAARSRRTIVLVLDDITVDPALAPRIRDAGRQMVARMSEGDEMAIVPLSGGEAGRSSSDPVELRRAIDRYQPRASGFMRPDSVGEQVLRTVAMVSRQLAESGARRRTIVRRLRAASSGVTAMNFSSGTR